MSSTNCRWSNFLIKWILFICNNSWELFEQWKLSDEQYYNVNPQDGAIYEFNMGIDRSAILGENLIVPIVTEHYLFKGHFADTERFWQQSFTFMMVDKSTYIEKSIFGHYPPIYSQLNIPNFQQYSFDTKDDKLYVSFAADSLIYLYNAQGNMQYSFGCAAPNVKQNYVSTSTFEEAMERNEEDHTDYSYYKELIFAGNYLLRSYKNDGANSGGGIYFYSGDALVYDLATDQVMKPIGALADGTIIAVGEKNPQSNAVKVLKIKVLNK